MQPYFFPYIGYFQLMKEADVFVLYDDVQYIRRGWVNRNRILRNGAATWLTFPVEKRPQSTPIDEMYYMAGAEPVAAIVNAISDSYRKAMHHDDRMELLLELIDQEERNVALYNGRLLRRLAQEVGIRCEFRRSSEIPNDENKRGQDRILDICRHLGADRYTNAIGGVDLYDGETFRKRGIELRFIRTEPVPYRQFGGEFVPHLSIIDVLMFNSLEQTAGLLDRYELI